MQTNKTILIVGGAGYIGSHVAKLLSLSGYNLVIFDNLSTGFKSLAKWGILEVGELNSPDIERVIKQYQPSAVIHLAGACYVGESTRDPLKYYQNNVSSTITLLEAMRNHGIARLIFSSSCTVYGIPQTLPIIESSPLSPISPYGRSKLMIEQIIRDCASTYGINSTIFRFFNAAGADEVGEIGELHDPETHLIPLVLAATNPLQALHIYGDHYDTQDGTCIRDYLHVADIATAHLLALKQTKPNPFEIYNLGTGHGYSIKQIVDTARQITGLQIHTIQGSPRLGDPAELVADPVLANTKLGWHPVSSSIENILRTAWQWYQKK